MILRKREKERRVIALTLNQIEHLLVLLRRARSYNEPYWHQAEQRSLEQAMKGGGETMAAKKKSVAKKPTAKKKAK